MKACWILCAPRTGSSFLCELLNNLGIFPPFDHELLVDRKGPLQRGQAFGEWGRIYDNYAAFCGHPCLYAKMIFHQYFEFVSGVPKKQRYTTGWYERKYHRSMTDTIIADYNSDRVRNIFPGIRYIRLWRDPIYHAVSLYFARMTKKYHIYNQNELTQYMNESVPKDMGKLVEAYCDALEYRECWNRFLTAEDNILHVKYEELVSNPFHELSRIVTFLGLKANVEESIEKSFGEDRRIYRMTRRESETFANDLKKALAKKLL